MSKNNITTEEIISKIYFAFSTCSQTDVNFALELLKLIFEHETSVQPKLFQYVCETWGTVKSSKEITVPEQINKTNYSRLELLYGETVDAMLLSYTRRGLLEGWNREQFYQNLWSFVAENAMWSCIEEKAFALYYIAIDVRTPYYNVGTGLKMSEDDFSNIQDEIFEAVREFRFIMALDCPQKTEEASLVFNLLNRMETEEQKIVLISRIISHFNKKIDNIINRVKNR